MAIRMPEGRALKILGFTDTHIDGNAGCAEWTMLLVRETIAAEKPDMVVFVGDNVTGADNYERTRAFTDMMSGLGVPWCPVLGNHEGDNAGSISRTEMMEIFRSSPCCAIPDSIEMHGNGRSDYTVDVKNAGGDNCFRLIFMDGGAYMTEDEVRRYSPEYTGTAYAFLGVEQIAWYRAQVKGCGCKSIVFCHIPLPEFKEGEIISGMNREGICCPPYNSGMFEAMAEEGSTVAFVCGHDHINDSHVLHRGIRLVYNRMSGLSSYNVISKGISDRLIQGCTVYNVCEDGHVEYGDIYYEDRYPNYREEILKIIKK